LITTIGTSDFTASTRKLKGATFKLVPITKHKSHSLINDILLKNYLGKLSPKNTMLGLIKAF
jgi:hypothetical protein